MKFLTVIQIVTLFHRYPLSLSHALNDIEQTHTHTLSHSLTLFHTHPNSHYAEYSVDGETHNNSRTHASFLPLSYPIPHSLTHTISHYTLHTPTQHIHTHTHTSSHTLPHIPHTINSVDGEASGYRHFQQRPRHICISSFY